MRAPGADVVLVTIDTLRADAVGAYGRARRGDPLDRPPRPRGRSLRDGARPQRDDVAVARDHALRPLPLSHGIRDNSGFRFPKDLATLATVLQARGYRTGAFVSSFVLDSRFGLDRGFDVYDDRVGGGEGHGGVVVPERPGPETVAPARHWLDSGDGKPSLLFLHLYGPHSPYEPPEPFASRFRAEPYHGEVAAADSALEPLLRSLLDARPRRPTLVVLTSDHGEGLGQHGEDTHGVFGYEGTLRVPLVLWAPGLLPPRVVKDPVRLVDVMPTILDLIGIEPPTGLDGQSLLPLAVGRPSPAPDAYFEALSSSLDRGWAPLYGIVADSLKYVELPMPELYDLAKDPAEETNLAAQRPADLERLRTRLLGLRGEGPGGPARDGGRGHRRAPACARVRFGRGPGQGALRPGGRPEAAHRPGAPRGGDPAPSPRGRLRRGPGDLPSEPGPAARHVLRLDPARVDRARARRPRGGGRGRPARRGPASG